MNKLTAWKEVKRQLENAPSFAATIEKIKQSKPDHLQSEHLDYVDRQIEEALKNKGHRLIFLLGPFGVGKTTQIHYFIRQRPELNYTLRSFIKIKTLDHAFLHLTNYVSRSASLALFFLLSLLFVWLVPATGALPFLLTTSYLFVKNAGNLVYILHQLCDNLFSRKDRIVVIEDLERSPLESPDQWALLSNLWHLKRTYLVPIGYSTENENNSKFKALEYAQKLGGIVIEIMPYTQLNFSIIKKLDPDFPFMIDHDIHTKKGDWLSLFTPREMWTIYEQTYLRTLHKPGAATKQEHYISVCLEFLIAKLGLSRREINYDPEVKAIKPIIEQTLSAEQSYFISSLKESISI